MMDVRKTQIRKGQKILRILFWLTLSSILLVWAIVSCNAEKHAFHFQGYSISNPECQFVQPVKVTITDAYFHGTRSYLDLADGTTLEVRGIVNSVKADGFYVIRKDEAEEKVKFAAGPFDQCPLPKK